MKCEWCGAEIETGMYCKRPKGCRSMAWRAKNKERQSDLQKKYRQNKRGPKPVYTRACACGCGIEFQTTSINRIYLDSKHKHRHHYWMETKPGHVGNMPHCARCHSVMTLNREYCRYCEEEIKQEKKNAASIQEKPKARGCVVCGNEVRPRQVYCKQCYCDRDRERNAARRKGAAPGVLTACKCGCGIFFTTSPTGNHVYAQDCPNRYTRRQQKQKAYRELRKSREQLAQAAEEKVIETVKRSVGHPRKISVKRITLEQRIAAIIEAAQMEGYNKHRPDKFVNQILSVTAGD